jgi:Transposase.
MTGEALLHQILPETGQQPGANHLEDSDSFWWWCYRSIPHHQDQRRPTKCSATSKRSWLFFFLLTQCGTSQGQTITKVYYRDVLHRLHDAVRCKRPELWSRGNWRLHHDNAAAHSSHLIQTFFWHENHTPVVRQASYSPDMAVPQTQEAIERKAISDKRGYYDCNDSWAKHHSERGFLGMFPTMTAPLGEVPRRLLWGWLGSQQSRYACLFFPCPKIRYFPNSGSCF